MPSQREDTILSAAYHLRSLGPETAETYAQHEHARRALWAAAVAQEPEREREDSPSEG